MKLGGGKRSIVIQFIADTVKAARDIDNLTKKMDKARSMSSRGGAGISSGFSSWDRDWYKNAFASPGWQQGLISRTRGPIIPRDRNVDFLARRKFELGIGKLGESAGNASGSILGMIGKFGKMAGVIGIVILGLRTLGKVLGTFFGKILHHGNLIEGNLIQMEVLLGNQRRANDMMKEAIRFSMLTPFTPEETFGAVTASLQYNIDPFKRGAYGLGQNQNVMQILSGLGSFRDIRGQALGVERAAHAVMRGDYRLLRPYRGIVQPAFETAKKVGHVGTPAFTQTFIRELGKIPQIMAMAERHSNSMAGMWSTIKGFAEEFWISISGAGEMAGVVTFWSQLKDIVKDIRDAGIQIMDYLKPGLTEIGSAIGSVFTFIWDLLKQIGKLLGPVLVPGLKIIWQLIRLIFVFVEQILYFVMWIIRVVVQLVSIFVGWFDKLFGLSDRIKAMTSWLVDFIAGMKAAFELDKIYLEWLVDNIGVKFNAFIDRMLKKLREVWDFLKRFYQENHRLIDFFLTFGMSEALQTDPNRSALGTARSVAGSIAAGASKVLQSEAVSGVAGVAGRAAQAVVTGDWENVASGGNGGTVIDNRSTTVHLHPSTRNDARDAAGTVAGQLKSLTVPRIR